jgi:hypothetical protein
MSSVEVMKAGGALVLSGMYGTFLVKNNMVFS